MDRITTIATYSRPFQAEGDRQALEQEGIRTFLADGNIVGANWLWSEWPLWAWSTHLSTASSDASGPSRLPTPSSISRRWRGNKAVAVAGSGAGRVHWNGWQPRPDAAARDQ